MFEDVYVHNHIAEKINQHEEILGMAERYENYHIFLLLSLSKLILTLTYTLLMLCNDLGNRYFH